jgi:type II secretory pathway pseudopilin PulG
MFDPSTMQQQQQQQQQQQLQQVQQQQQQQVQQQPPQMRSGVPGSVPTRTVGTVPPTMQATPQSGLPGHSPGKLKCVADILLKQ